MIPTVLLETPAALILILEILEHACSLLCHRLLENAASASPEDLEGGLVEARDVLLSHKHAGPLRVDITIKMGGGFSRSSQLAPASVICTACTFHSRSCSMADYSIKLHC